MTGVTRSDTDSPWRRVLITPEGIDLSVEIATMGARATAFFLDVIIIAGAMAALAVATILLLSRIHPTQESGQWVAGVAGVVLVLGFFLFRNCYFLYFELGSRAAPPGKRAAGLRVIARNGGALTAQAIFTRNALRELEVFLPLSFLVMKPQGLDTFTVLAGLVWSGVFALFPLMNRDRLRVGDLVAGTAVVRERNGKLKRDLTTAIDRHAPTSVFDFSPAQLAIYGVKELQLLEEVLRTSRIATQKAVADRIRTKIGWRRSETESDFEFLEAFYASLRGRLEREVIMGRRKADKFDKGR